MTKLDALINDVFREMSSKWDWPWLNKRQLITTIAEIVTGTVSVTGASTAVTFSSAPAASVAGYHLLVDGNATENALFRISTHTAAAAGAVLDSAYTGATDTAAGYHLWKDEYDLATDTGKVLFVRRYGFPQPLLKIGPYEMSQIKSYNRAAAPLQMWAVDDFATTGDATTKKQLIVHPFPDDTYRLEIHYKLNLITEYTGSTVLPLPQDYHHVLEWGVLGYGYPLFLNDINRGTYYLGRYGDALNLMQSQMRDEQGGNPTLQIEDTHRQFYRRNRRLRTGKVDLGGFFDRLPFNP